MGIFRTDWHWFEGWGNGYHTIDVDLPPNFIGAEIQLHGKSGGGTIYSGIKSFRRRLPSGADEPVNFGEWPGWPPVEFDFMSSITFGIAAGEDQGGYALARMDFWE